MLFLNLFPVYQNIWWVLPCKRGGTVLYIRIFGGCCLVREWATVLYIRIFGGHCLVTERATVLYIRIFGGCCLVTEEATVLYIRICGDTGFKLFMFMLWHELLPLDLDNGFREIYKYYLCIVYFLMNMYFGWHTKFCLLNNRKYFTLVLLVPKL
jgi:hypothetical protein